MHTIGPGIWQANWKTWKMRNTPCGSEIWRRTLKMWKMRNAHCRKLECGKKTENHGK